MSEPAPLDLVAEALRKSHCSRTGEEHACVGECTLTAAGVKLSCHLCGNGSDRYGPPLRYFEMAKRIVAGLLDFDLLAPEAQRRLAGAVQREMNQEETS